MLVDRLGQTFSAVGQMHVEGFEADRIDPIEIISRQTRERGRDLDRVASSMRAHYHVGTFRIHPGLAHTREMDVHGNWQLCDAEPEDIEAHLDHVASLAVFADELCLRAVDAVDPAADSGGYFQASHVKQP